MIRRVLKLGISLTVRSVDVLWGWCCAITGGARPARCVVLYYHAIPADQRERFIHQMDEVLRLASPVSADHGIAPSSAARRVMITFDDGFASVVENALPVLRKRKIPCAVFVPSGCLGQHPGWLRNAANGARHERVVSAEQLHVLAEDPLVTVGSHSRSHPNLLTLSPETAALEFSGSKSDLEQVTGAKVDFFSFPFGAHSGALLQTARESGYRRVFTSEPAFAFRDNDEFATGRVSVDPGDWGWEFRLKVVGAYRWSACLQNAKRKLRGLYKK